MRTVSRLEKVYQSAHIVEFNDESKFVFFSDTHRGDDGLSDDFGRNKHIYNFALSDYYKRGSLMWRSATVTSFWNARNSST